MKTRIAVYTTPEFKKELKVYAALKTQSLSAVIHEALILLLNPARQDPRFRDDCDTCKFNEEQTSRTSA